MSNKLDIKNEMAAFDRKDRNYYDELTDDEKKKFSTYLMLKWGSAVYGSFELESYYLRAVNERVNIDFFELRKHPKLQWLLCTTASPGLGQQKHYYPRAQAQSQSPEMKFLKQIYPNSKIDELELLVKLNDKGYFRDLAKQYGWSDKEIKDHFGK